MARLKPPQTVLRLPAVPAALLAAMSFWLLSTPAPAQNPTPRQRCDNDTNVFTSDVVIRGCTVIIENNTDKPLALARARRQRGNALVAAGAYDRAIEDYTQAIALDPKSALGFNNRGVAYHKKGDEGRAIADYTKAIALDPKYARAYSNRGASSRANGDDNKALADYIKAIALDPNEAGAHGNLANVYHARGDEARAIAEYAKAIKLDPKDPDFFINRGLAYNAGGHYDLAVADDTRAIALDPNSFSAYSNRGEAYYGKGDQDLAITDFTTAIKLKPDALNAYVDRGNAYYTQGRFDLAITDYTKAISLDAKDAPSHLNRAGSYWKKGALKLAIADYKKTLELDPKYAAEHDVPKLLDELQALDSPTPAAPSTPITPSPALAAPPAVVSKAPTPPAGLSRRVALVVGNSAYRNAAQLVNPKNDAQDMAVALQRIGFETIVGLDLDKAGFDDITIRFSRAARDADVAMVYYSGHGIQVAGVNYLIPVDAKLTDEADLRRLLRVDDIVADIQQAKNLRILVLDACRDNPFADDIKRGMGRSRGMSVERGLAKIESAQGMITAFSTQAKHTADDGRGRNSPYTAALLEHIEEQEEIGTIFRRVAKSVYDETNHEQLPELSLSLIGEFYLKGQRPGPH